MTAGRPGIQRPDAGPVGTLRYRSSGSGLCSWRPGMRSAWPSPLSVRAGTEKTAWACDLRSSDGGTVVDVFVSLFMRHPQESLVLRQCCCFTKAAYSRWLCPGHASGPAGQGTACLRSDGTTSAQPERTTSAAARAGAARRERRLRLRRVRAYRSRWPATVAGISGSTISVKPALDLAAPVLKVLASNMGGDTMPEVTTTTDGSRVMPGPGLIKRRQVVGLDLLKDGPVTPDIPPAAAG
jgi:hypothetical protein